MTFTEEDTRITEKFNKLFEGIFIATPDDFKDSREMFERIIKGTATDEDRLKYKEMIALGKALFSSQRKS